MADRSPLYWQVYERLTDDTSLDARARALVEAAFDGEQAVHEALGGTRDVDPGARPAPPPDVTPARAYLRRIAIEGFRGIGREALLELPPGPGLTLVVGRNGSGKSSLAEGLETLLTGNSMRWAQKKTTDWIGGFRNLHQRDPVMVTAEFDIDGEKAPLRLRRSWGPDDEPADGRLRVLASPKPDATLESLGWRDALETFRPILSYNELGKALEAGPSHLFDQLRGVLGMEEMSAAEKALAAVRKARDPVAKAAKAGREPLEVALASLAETDGRAAAALALFRKRNPDLVELLQIASGDAADEARIKTLRALASLATPEDEAVLHAARELREAVAERRRLAEAAAGLQSATADLLERALYWHEREGGALCPVCETEGGLGDAWRQRTRERLAALKESADAMQGAQRRERGAVDAARKLIRAIAAPTPSDLPEHPAAAAAHAVWAAAPEDALALADHLEGALDALRAAYATLSTQAEAELGRTQAQWQPVRRQLERWIEQAEQAERAAADVKLLKAAEDWVKRADEELRAERFAPIRSRAQEIWEKLRHQSNVAIRDIRLTGKTTNRKVELDVRVDGEDAVALGVMSQGELHAMLLSLFLPRLTLDESPFGFVVIDDPVQAMDPAKVDGLAQVLADVARTRQVIVFTHDARLPEAVRRLQLPATVIEVTRKSRSVVDLRRTKDAASQLLDDALAVAKEQDKLGPTLTARIVPGLCRTAVEARLKELVWHRRLAEGCAHADIEAEIADAHSMNDLATLALVGEAHRGKDLLGRLNAKCGRAETDTFQDLKTYAHQKFTGNPEHLVDRTRQLLRSLQP